MPPVAQGVIDDGAPSAALHPKVVVQAGDIILAKPHFGSFQATELETILRARGVCLRTPAIHERPNSLRTLGFPSTAISGLPEIDKQRRLPPKPKGHLGNVG